MSLRAREIEVRERVGKCDQDFSTLITHIYSVGIIISLTNRIRAFKTHHLELKLRVCTDTSCDVSPAGR